MCDHHPWKLIAPWYRWQRQLDEHGHKPRQTRPVFQKYETADLVNVFLRDPQLSLRFRDEDYVHKVRKRVPIPTITSGPLAGRQRVFSGTVLEKTGTPKMFLPSHKRFYLVVCELHCDTPGLPNASRDKVCEAGFVVRRRYASYPMEAEPAAVALLGEVTALSTQLAQLERKVPARTALRKRRTRGGAGVLVGSMAGAVSDAKARVHTEIDASVETKRTELRAELALARRKLAMWGSAAGVRWVHEGWVPDPNGFENLGSWQVVEETPQQITEAVFPLYPLVPDPTVEGHDATGRTIYFGILPTGGTEVDAAGAARFDDRTGYTVRCFVRRHRCECPKTGERNDCGGEVVWSEPTERYQLASHFDPIGTGNRPVTIQLPDIPALAAAGETRLPVAMAAPPGSALNFRVKDGEPVDAGVGELPQICFFSIPLITIIATFVLNLFLPIVVFLFNLWFLLGLKFCIPPSLSIEAGLKAELDAELELALELEVDLDVNVDLNTTLGARQNALLIGEKGLVGGTLRAGTPGRELADSYSNPVLLDLEERLTRGRAEEVEDPSLAAGLEYEPRVEVAVRVA